MVGLAVEKSEPGTRHRVHATAGSAVARPKAKYAFKLSAQHP